MEQRQQTRWRLLWRQGSVHCEGSVSSSIGRSIICGVKANSGDRGIHFGCVNGNNIDKDTSSVVKRQPKGNDGDNSDGGDGDSSYKVATTVEAATK